MSADNDTCDYCDKYVDPIGGDLARHTIPPLFWCGVCPEGLQVVYGGHTDAQLRTIIQAADETFAIYGRPHEFRERVEQRLTDDEPSATQYEYQLYYNLLRMEENQTNARKVLSNRVLA